MLQQNTSAWHQWRINKIGASDVASILGISPYKTKRELFLEKTGKIEQTGVSNFVQEKGHRLEKIARAKYEILTAQEFPDSLVEHSEYDFIAASLDGYNKETNHHIEIKYVGKNFKFNNVDELIEAYPHYFAQVQYQLFITGGTADIVQITDSNEIKAISVLANVEYISSMISEVIKFWECVKAGVLDKDLDDSKEELLKQYKELDKEIKQKTKQLEDIKEKILDGLDTSKQKYDSDFGKITLVEKQGNINYKNIPELKNIDLEKYRGKTISYWSIK